ncbi:MAG TPA: MOSC and FAD-binding oxidoreductase domain-containing protein [Kribbella sp.]|nr:MOSC and FAD-binding oxidoreductase domain-containing protein [Kribbella sp.]
MKLVSVNVGKPRVVTWRGRQVRSSIWKTPVTDRRRVGRLNVAGDAQADLVGHGGEHRAVFVYQVGSYRHWERQLGRSLPGFGWFGENFTVDGLYDDEVCIGDRYAIGSALFEVTQPRVTCYKVGIRLDEPRMPALLTGHGRPGFYLRVLEEGEVGAGDAIVRVSTGLHRLTVRRVSAMLYTPDFDDHALRQALENPALSEGWKWSFRQLLEQNERGASGNSGLSPLTGDPPPYAGFRRFRVAQTMPESVTVRSLLLEPADGEAVPAYRPGQFVILRLTDGQGATLTRSYSISGYREERSLRVSVKRDGRASTIVHDRIKVGDQLEVGAPRGSFVLEPAGQDGTVVLISAGIGVTPVLAMLGALAERRSRRAVTWIHVARRGAEHAFAHEAREMIAMLPRATSYVLYTRPGPADRLGDDFDAAGRLTRERLAAMRLSPHDHAYVCGPTGFMADVTAMLQGLGLDAAHVHTETFGSISGGTAARPHVPSRPAASGPEVSFVRSGISVRYDRERWGSLLELAEDCDVPVTWSCRTGVCHRCESAMVAGDVYYDPEPLDLPAPGNTLLCCASPAGDLALDL